MYCCFSRLKYQIRSEPRFVALLLPILVLNCNNLRYSISQHFYAVSIVSCANLVRLGIFKRKPTVISFSYIDNSDIFLRMLEHYSLHRKEVVDLEFLCLKREPNLCPYMGVSKSISSVIINCADWKHHI